MLYWETFLVSISVVLALLLSVSVVLELLFGDPVDLVTCFHSLAVASNWESAYTPHIMGRVAGMRTSVLCTLG